MIFLTAIFAPPIALLIRDAKNDAVASLAMICAGFLLAPALVPYLWIAAIVHAFAVLRKQDADRRTADIIDAIRESSLPSLPLTKRAAPDKTAIPTVYVAEGVAL